MDTRQAPPNHWSGNVLIQMVQCYQRLSPSPQHTPQTTKQIQCKEKRVYKYTQIQIEIAWKAKYSNCMWDQLQLWWISSHSSTKVKMCRIDPRWYGYWFKQVTLWGNWPALRCLVSVSFLVTTNYQRGFVRLILMWFQNIHEYIQVTAYEGMCNSAERFKHHLP